MASKILLVDDEALLDLLSRYLRQEGYTALTATGGPEAVQLAYTCPAPAGAGRDQPDLVVLDLMLPGMDGWELCARLHELADFPIILLSARSSESDTLRGLRLGVEDYVTKPFSLAELGAWIRAVLTRNQPRPTQVGPLYASGNMIVDMDKRAARNSSR